MPNSPLQSNIVILISRDGMGSAELPLQLKLIATYLKLLDANGNLPAAICFYADGVKLVVEGSPVIEELKTLEARGVRLCIICSPRWSGWVAQVCSKQVLNPAIDQFSLQ